MGASVGQSETYGSKTTCWSWTRPATAQQISPCFRLEPSPSKAPIWFSEARFMPLLPRRFERLKSVLNQRMADLTVLIEHVEKPHNLSAILRSCDAVGGLEAHAVSLDGRPRTFNSTAQGSQKWVHLHDPH